MPDVQDAKINQAIEGLAAEGISRSKAHRLLQRMFQEQYSLTVSQLTNKLQKCRGPVIPDGKDAEHLEIILNTRSENDSNFYYAIDRDDGHLSSVFIMDANMKRNWLHSNCIIVYDVTNNKNNYKMPLAIFVGQDNENNTLLCGFALMANESQKCHEWVFQNALSASSIAPKVLMTDADPSVIASCRTVFPGTKHLLCWWHIRQNMLKKTSKYKQKDSFLKAFEAVVRLPNSKLFEEGMEKIMASHQELNDYIQGYLLPKKEMWAAPWTGEFFSCGSISSQRVESFNALVKKTLKGTSGLVDTHTFFRNQARKPLKQPSRHTWRLALARLPHVHVMNHCTKVLEFLEDKVSKLAIDRMLKSMAASLILKVVTVNENPQETFHFYNREFDTKPTRTVTVSLIISYPRSNTDITTRIMI